MLYINAWGCSVSMHHILSLETTYVSMHHILSLETTYFSWVLACITFCHRKPHISLEIGFVNLILMAKASLVLTQSVCIRATRGKGWTPLRSIANRAWPPIYAWRVSLYDSRIGWYTARNTELRECCWPNLCLYIHTYEVNMVRSTTQYTDRAAICAPFTEIQYMRG